MFETLALVGGFWFFLFVVFIAAFGIFAAEIDSAFAGTITLVLLAVGAQFLFSIPVWQSIVANPFLVIVGIAVYIAIGLAYGVMFRYADFLRKNSDSITRSWKSFQKDRPQATTSEFRKSYEYRDFTPSYNSDRIAAWVMLWPWAAFWDLCHKPIRWAGRSVYRLAGNMLDRVGEKVSDKIINEKK